MSYSYKTILQKAKTCQSNVKKEYKTGITSRWCYYFAKTIITPKKDVKDINIGDAPKPSGTYISNQLSKSSYMQVCKDLVKFVESKKRLPNYVETGKYKLTPHLLTEVLARIIVFYDKNSRLPSAVNVNSKVFTKPVESSNKVYKYFVKTFGSINSIDEALNKVKDKGYSYYYDDKYSNVQSIDRIKKGLGINCTDSCHVFYNVVLGLIERGKYKKVECLHVQCSSGGHVKLRITLNDGSRIIRDPACVLSKNGKSVSCVWCTNSGNVNPSWFMANLNR